MRISLMISRARAGAHTRGKVSIRTQLGFDVNQGSVCRAVVWSSGALAPQSIPFVMT
jgi:hypothetical protein